MKLSAKRPSKKKRLRRYRYGTSRRWDRNASARTQRPLAAILWILVLLAIGFGAMFLFD
ncbi:hypothetical protein [Dongshaea marina]|uniref:hypothetical protein n=1 Tax=Dongshaea marina TaxID=2047966 RepID=UPI00131F11E0|nr:hypothetical protein [Dongshaea marina]